VKTIKDKRILKSIKLFPVISILLMGVIFGVVIAVFLNNFKQERIKDKKETLFFSEKKLAKEMVLSVENDIINTVNSVESKTKELIKNKIYIAVKLIDKYIQENPGKSKSELKKEIANILSVVRWNNGRGYYFVYDKDTKKSVIHPIKKFIGKDMSHFRDKRGTLLVKLYEKTIDNKKGEGYANIYFAKPSIPNKEFEKIVFVKKIKQLNWVIGTGEYIDDMEKRLQKELLKKIQQKRYAKHGYFWIHSTDGYLLAHPFRKNQIGKYDLDLEDKKGTKIIKLFIKEAKLHKNGAFVKYYWYKPHTKIMEEKISFVKLIEKWNWVIGTGVYISDIDKKAKELQMQINYQISKLYKVLFGILIALLIVVIVFSLYLSNKTQHLFTIYKEDLEHKIKQAVEENTKKDKLLQQQSKMAAMGEMIGAIAHQWRQPLNALGLIIQDVEEAYHYNELNEEYIQSMIKNAMQQIMFMSKTIDDFRNFFRIDKKKELFSVKKSIEEIKNMLEAQLKSHNIKLTIMGDDFSINGLENEFKQVILNIINNAKDAIIENKIRDGKIEIVLQNNKIIIRDNAGGIAENIIDRIFEPYFTTKEQGKGTGMGLYMSKMIIEENMNGRISVKNNTLGAEFEIELQKE